MSAKQWTVLSCLVVIALCLLLSWPKPKPTPAPAAVQVDTTGWTASQHEMIDSAQKWMRDVGWQVRCYTVLLAKKHWSPGGVNFTVEVDTGGK